MKATIGYKADSLIANLPSVHKFASIEDVNESDILLVDLMDIEHALEVINHYRKINPNQPVLWKISYKDHFSIHHLITKVLGKGRLFTITNFERIDEYIEKILNPQLASKKEEIAFVIPVYNEEIRFHHLTNFINKIHLLNEKILHNMTIYFMNDGSSDNSLKLMGNLKTEYMNNNDFVMTKEPIKIKNLVINTRKAGTYIESFKEVTEDIIIFADADDGYEFEDVMRMLNLLEVGYYDMIVGTKDLIAENRPTVRRFVSFMKRLLTRPLLPSGVSDSQTGLKVFRSNMLNYIISDLDIRYGLAIDLKILNTAKKYKLRVYEMPVRFNDREDSHINVVKDSLRFIYAILLIVFNRKKGIIQ